MDGRGVERVTNRQGGAVESKERHVVVVGGGISGLAAAYHLHRQGETCQISLLEKDARLGGKIVTDRIDGYTVEGGPDCFLSRKPRGTGLTLDLGIAEELRGRQAAYAKTYVRRGRELYRLPAGLSGMIPTDLGALEETPLLSAEGKTRLAQEVTQPLRADSGDESLAAFVTRRMGREAYERLVEPLMGGIYAGDAAQLSLAATFPQLKNIELEYGSLLEGLGKAAPARGPEADAYPPFVTFENGMDELVQQMHAQMKSVNFVTGTAITELTADNGGYRLQLSDGTSVCADAVILATPAHVTAKLTAEIDSDLAEAHAAIPYASSAIVTLAYDMSDIDHPLDGYGYVIPGVEQTDNLACTWSSRKWEHRAPDGHVLMRLYVGRYGRRDVLRDDDRTLTLLAREELRTTLSIEAKPSFSKVYRWPKAMPQYTMGHLDRLDTINARLAGYPGLYVAGAAYRGVGIPDCILSGETAAAAALEYLDLSDTNSGYRGG
jgi:oxygen-dependent protoporphyrinogen oxidase